MGIGLMTAPKKPRKRPGPKPDPTRIRDETTMIRSTTAWKRAIERLADWDRAPSVSDLIDRALANYAREKGYSEPLPKR